MKFNHEYATKYCSCIVLSFMVAGVIYCGLLDVSVINLSLTSGIMSKVTASASVFAKDLSLVNIRLAFGTSQTVAISTGNEYLLIKK